MNKRRIYIVIILTILILLYVFVPSKILLEPKITPTEYLNLKPYIKISDIHVIVPSSTIIVYLLGILILYISYDLYKRNLPLWSISMLFWGLSTILAGSSYQGFGYELKCAGKSYCQFTSFFETSYLFFTAISISLLGIAFSKLLYNKTWLIIYSKIALVLYTILLLLGSILNSYWLVSYELFTVFFMPIFVILFIINIKEYRDKNLLVHLNFIKLWLLFLFINISYYLYYIPNLTDKLFVRTGIWFSANDVLHIGLIIWFVFFIKKVTPQISMLSKGVNNG